MVRFNQNLIACFFFSFEEHKDIWMSIIFFSGPKFISPIPAPQPCIIDPVRELRIQYIIK